MIDNRDQDAWEIKKLAFQDAVNGFQERYRRDPAFATAIFRISLIALGFKPYEIAAEIAIHTPAGRPPCQP